MTGAQRIAAERQRQIEVEGYDAEHDAGHADELAMAGACYAAHERMAFRIMTGDGWSKTVPTGWPWDGAYWRPTPDDRVRELTKAGALIAAAIDALLSEEAPPMTTPDGLTAESETLVREQQGRVSGLPSGVLRDRLAAIEAAAEERGVTRHVRDTGCEGLREAAEEAASWLELRPDYTEGDAATASRLRAALAAPAASPEASDD